MQDLPPLTTDDRKRGLRRKQVREQIEDLEVILSNLKGADLAGDRSL